MTVPPEFNTAWPLASNVTVAATVLPVVDAFNKILLLAAPFAIATSGISVAGVYSVPVAEWNVDVVPTKSVKLAVMLNVLPLPGAASVKVIVPVAGL